MKLRNIAIIAHVDHGKTTLVDRLLQQSGSFRENQRVAERALDSNDLERERGITILSKVTSILWQDIRINIVDTPGHADFGGEVERILNMVDGALVLVDAAEGPLPQTKFVVTKALKVGLRPIVVINKVDRPDARPTEVANEVFDLFAALDASEEQLDFPILYGSAKQGWMASDASGPKDQGMAPLFDLVVRHVAQPAVEEGPFRMLGTILESNPYLGRIVTGRISSGSVKPNQMIKVLDRNGVLVEEGRATKVLAFRGLERTPIDEAFAGDIVSIAGLPDATVSHTLCATEVTEPLPAQPIDPPTLAMTFRINDSPLAGTEGDKVQSRVIRERLLREAEGNVALRISESIRKRLHGGRRTRRVATRHPHRNHAARRFRAFRIAPEGLVSARRLGRPARTHRGSRHRCRRAAFRRGRAKARRTQRRAGGDASVGRRARATRTSMRRRAD